MKNTWFLCVLCGLLPVSTLAQHLDSTSAYPTKPVPPYQLSQQERQQIVDMAADPDATFRNVRTFDGRYEGLRGTPYFLPVWTNGQIELTNGQRYTNVLIKFDAHQQELVLLRPQAHNDSIIIDRPRVNHFRLGTSAAGDTDGRTYLFKRYPTLKADDPVVADGYFLVLYEGKTALLKRVAKSFQPADYKAAYSSGVRYDTYSDAHAYYVLKPDNTLTKVKLSKKSLLDALADKGDALKTFVDSHRLTIKSENDAVTLVQQYDSL